MEALPWQFALQKVGGADANGFKVVSTTLLEAYMSVGRSVPRCSGQTFIFFTFDVETAFWVLVPFCKTKVNNKDCILILSISNEKIIRLYIPMNIVIIMYGLNPANHLISYHEGSLDCKLASAVLEEVFEAGAKELHYHCVIVTFDTRPKDFWYAKIII